MRERWRGRGKQDEHSLLLLAVKAERRQGREERGERREDGERVCVRLSAGIEIAVVENFQLSAAQLVDSILRRKHLSCHIAAHILVIFNEGMLCFCLLFVLFI